ncbi:MAG: NOL1/NOP2/sun family putative RNA methylase [Candidatus Bilamarchaeum sp.]
MKNEIPELFKERYCSIVDDSESFISSIQTFRPKSYRVNTLKAQTSEIIERFNGYGIESKPVSWCNYAFVSDNLEIGSTLEHFLGKIYIQELTSMLPPLVLTKEIEEAENPIVLDACAAPGSKTTQLSAVMQNRGTLIANDIDYGRIRALRFNVERSGAVNTIITNQDFRTYPELQVDSVLLDAPCSAEGTARKNYDVFRIWSERKIASCANMQKQLITKAFDLLKEGGSLIYSTCTFAPEENEAVVDYLLGKRPDAKLDSISIPGLNHSKGLTSFEDQTYDQSISKCVRVWPHQNDTDGFFLVKVKK